MRLFIERTPKRLMSMGMEACVNSGPRYRPVVEHWCTTSDKTNESCPRSCMPHRVGPAISVEADYQRVYCQTFIQKEINCYECHFLGSIISRSHIFLSIQHSLFPSLLFSRCLSLSLFLTGLFLSLTFSLTLFLERESE